MSKKINKIAGWVLSIILGLLFAFSAYLKLSQNEIAVAQATSMGFTGSVYRMIGVIELVALGLFLIPRTGILGSLLLIAYMGGAIATHLQHNQPVFMAVAVQVLVWIAFVLRYPTIVQQLFPAAQKLIKQQ
ncbi:DoxX family protein [Emticicia fontis]